MRRAGRVYQRVPGRGKPWSYIVDVGPEGGPRKQQRRHRFKTQSEARAALNAVLASLASGTFVQTDDIRFGTYLERWVESLASRRQPTTVDSYRRQLRCHVFGHPISRIRLQRVSAVQLDALYAELLDHGRTDGRGGLSARSVRFLHAIIGKALNDALKKHLVATNVALAADPPSAKAARPPETGTWSPEQIRQFLDSVNDDRVYALWRLLALTGMRRGEGCGLRWSDIDFDSKRLAVRQTLVPIGSASAAGGDQLVFGPAKSDSGERVVDLDEGTVAALRAHRAKQAAEKLAMGAGYRDANLVFCGVDGSPLNPRRLTEWFGRRSKAAGLPPIRLHDLRHSHATILLARGEAPKVVAERLGHSSPTFTMGRYQHVLPGMQADTARRFADLVDGQG